VPVKVTVEGQCALPSDVHVALYRIAQEALNNVVKHARASQVTVRLAAVRLRCASGEDVSSAGAAASTSQGGAAGEGIELHVSDDGCGFDAHCVSPDSLGLGIMRERAQAVGATLEVESEPGSGTHVAVVWTRGE
jgi:signal transduction histidine kinase